ncbi:MAG: elongation factor G [Flavobacteriales bacterium]|nr:elongation factor G [Flavobacteriia bacterium]NCP06461.1 elongation factor G [Flavobacteriales bacterium]PIV94997.1 MAG: elongation factor G [Flavobacteriaceae bacterium CG17_big_fil_post_rev_8_21_14_2_50_33_15]PIY12609.1 MAG: elongation factor G [Flavobacteriaceae bacterium CG_4_10_14_3_um_filter_33_47]PJB16329.1 MAG: elongation factor G [Flavobacteriaceae bacterium CG_4_9_14_3_um_filter_33_16]
MKIFDEKHIKNIVLVGAHHSGKTTLSETMLFEAGLLNRRGTVEDHNTVSDYHSIEHDREASIYATPMHTEWRNYKINIIDTPGLDDFIGEIISSIRVGDTVVTVINGRQGVEVGTEIIWNYIDKYNRPTLFVINQIDHPDFKFDESFNSIKSLVGNHAVKMQYPLVVDGAQCIIDVLKMKMYKFGKDGGKPEKLEIPDHQKALADELHNELVEKAAENDEDLLDLFFDKGTLNEDEMRRGIKAGMLNHELFPVFCVSALNDMGTGRLMGFIDNVAPAASELNEEQSVEGDLINREVGAPTSLFVFKTIQQPNLGQITFFKVKSGEVNVNDKLVNSKNNETEIINQLFIMDGKERQPVTKLTVGDIGATLKLKYTDTNDTLRAPKSNITIKPIKFPEPRIKKRISAAGKQDDEKLIDALKKIHSQDPTVILEFSQESKQQLLGCQGELHLATIDWTLKNVYGLQAKFDKPKITYRETIQRSSTASYKHKKQSGGSGQFGEVHMKIEPWNEGMPEPEGFSLRGKEEVELPWGGKLIFYNCIVGGVIDQRYLPSVMKGVLEVMEDGPLTGSYIRDVRVMVFDGKMHSVDSNDISFKIAGAHAFKEAFLNANPKLLEPTNELVVKVPEDMVGNVMTDLQSRRSIIQGIESNDNYQILKSITPAAELYGYSTDLRALTQGRATFSTTFSSYQPVPPNVQNNLVKEVEQQEV